MLIVRATTEWFERSNKLFFFTQKLLGSCDKNEFNFCVKSAIDVFINTIICVHKFKLLFLNIKLLFIHHRIQKKIVTWISKKWEALKKIKCRQNQINVKSLIFRIRSWYISNDLIWRITQCSIRKKKAAQWAGVFFFEYLCDSSEHDLPYKVIGFKQKGN